MYSIIVNPVAGNGKGKRIFTKLKNTELYQSIDCISHVTEYEGHAEIIAEEIMMRKEKTSCVIVIGGDGTLHEVMNGLDHGMQSIAFIPGGSGNDFARGCRIKKDPLKAFEQIVTGEKRNPYWVGHYWIEGGRKRDFVNNIGFGFDAEVTEYANTSSIKKWCNALGLGTVSYVIALLYVLFHFKPRTVDITMDGKTKQITDCWMVTVANHPFYGGGMKIIPSATIQPEYFPVLIIQSISKWKVLALFITVFTGKHIHFKEVSIQMVKHFHIKSHSGMAYQTDGFAGYCQQCTLKKDVNPINIHGANLVDQHKNGHNSLIDSQI